MDDYLERYKQYINSKPLNLIRNLPYKTSPYNLTVQLPMWSTEDMTKIAQPLIEEIGGERGLLYTSRFRWEDYAKVRRFFENLGYSINDIDEREKDKKLRSLFNEDY